ncbi:uncharacterized protein LOC111329574 [Stylophora pistillata]|uniref:uncharacterized protein LOC111329574 n=1 Tax=Stylophora pistillata TaxID=50429 RepID=UPI000C055CD6|nr:uncharacterized protein LOC111329574 [Stylophora pistillata]
MAATTTVEAIYVPDNLDGKKYMKNQQWRLRIWICAGISTLIVLSAALAFIILILNFSVFLSQTYDLTQGDMRLISVSTAFCGEISLGQDSSTRKLWILPSSRVSPQLRITNISTDVLVSKFSYWYKSFYLLKGSSVVINAESDGPLKLFIFKDRQRRDEWILQNGDSTEKSGFSGEYSPQPSRISYTLSAKETGYYYILFKFSKQDNDVSKMNLGMTLSRKVYDVDSSVYSCSAGANEACSARLLIGSSEVGVLEVTQNPHYHNNDLVTTWQCEPRIWFYLAVFAGPVLFFTVGSFLFYFVFINRKRDSIIQRLAFHRQNALRRASCNGCDRCNSLGNRSLNGSLRPPSRTPSIRSLGNQTDVSRTASLQPVVTTMYAGNAASEDSGHDTDDDNKRTSNTGRRSKKRTSSVDGASFVSQESVSRRPSFSTFQGSEDECSNVVGNHMQSEPARKGHTGDRARKKRSDRREMREKIPYGTIPRNHSTRRNSSEELTEHTIRTLPLDRNNSPPTGHSDNHLKFELRPRNSSSRRYSSEELLDQALLRNEGNSAAGGRPNHQLKSEMENLLSKSEKDKPRETSTRRHSSDKLCEDATIKLPRNRGNKAPASHLNNYLEPDHDRPASLPSLQCPDGAWGLPLDLIPESQQRALSELTFIPPREEDTDIWEPQKIKLRTSSGRRRDMGWTPRLSIVSEA